MKKFFIGKETVACNNFELNYYILSNEKKTYTEYGIEVEKIDNYNIERSQVTDVTTSKTAIEDIAKSLMRNTVTPMHLHDIIIDML